MRIESNLLEEGDLQEYFLAKLYRWWLSVKVDFKEIGTIATTWFTIYQRKYTLLHPYDWEDVCAAI